MSTASVKKWYHSHVSLWVYSEQCPSPPLCLHSFIVSNCSQPRLHALCPFFFFSFCRLNVPTNSSKSQSPSLIHASTSAAQSAATQLIPSYCAAAYANGSSTAASCLPSKEWRRSVSSSLSVSPSNPRLHFGASVIIYTSIFCWPQRWLHFHLSCRCFTADCFRGEQIPAQWAGLRSVMVSGVFFLIAETTHVAIKSRGPL